MKLSSVAALAVLAAAPTFASAAAFNIDFEKSWDYSNGDIDGYYAGGAAADGTSGTNVGVRFTNVSGLSNDSSFTYYSNAPTALGTAYAHTFAPTDTAFIDIASGVGRGITFFYSSPLSIVGAVKAYSGLGGTGTLLGAFDVMANTTAVDGFSSNDVWTSATFLYSGMARSFDLTASANSVLFDNLASVPEPGTLPILLLGALGAVTLRRARRS